MSTQRTKHGYKRGKYWYHERMINGRRIVRALRVTSKVDADELIKKRDKQLDEVFNKIPDDARNITIKVLCQKFKNYVTNFVDDFSFKTKESYLHSADFLMNVIGDVKLAEVKLATIQDRIIPYFHEKGYNQSSQRHFMVVFRRIFN